MFYEESNIDMSFFIENLCYKRLCAYGISRVETMMTK